MKQYYLIRRESDPKIVGVKEGITQVEIRRSGFANSSIYDDLVSFFDTFNYWKKKSFAPTRDFDIEYVEILTGAKLTDFMGYRPYLIACPFIVSEKARSIFEEHVVQEHYYFPVRMYRTGQPVNGSYFLFYCPPLPFEVVDFARSVFYTGTMGLNERNVRFNDQQEYVSFLSKNPLASPAKIALSDMFNGAIDFFMPRIGGIYASEALAKRMVKEKLSGIKVITDTQCIFGT
jgi:hypothetical protein